MCLAKNERSSLPAGRWQDRASSVTSVVVVVVVVAVPRTTTMERTTEIPCADDDGPNAAQSKSHTKTRTHLHHYLVSHHLCACV